MKKLIPLFLLACCLSMSACGRKVPPITLPDPKNILSVDVITGETASTQKDPAWIEETLEGLSAAEPTRKQSISDTPQTEKYTRIDFRHRQSGTSTVFVYENGGKFYLEQPYQGVYEIDLKLYRTILEGPKPKH